MFSIFIRIKTKYKFQGCDDEVALFKMNQKNL